MAEIVLGIGTSHSPLLTMDAPMWLERGGDDMRNPALTMSDGRTMDYEALLAERGPVHAEQSREEHLAAQVETSMQAVERLADEIERAAPDVVLIIGDDQDELYKPGNTPSVAVHIGSEMVMRPLGQILSNPPGWMQKAIGGYAMDKAHRFPCDADFALALTERLMDGGVDLGVHTEVEDPTAAAFGHAFGFVAHRLFRGRVIPIVPLMLNTYFPPNVMRPRRAYEVGCAIADAVAGIRGDQRVAIVASGGLSHFVTDRALDEGVLAALRNDDRTALESIPMDALRAGSSEILCWILGAGAWRHLSNQWIEYIPVYRTPAGTGIGLAFAAWSKFQAAS